MNKPVYPTIQTAFLFQKFASVNWQLYGKTEGKHMGIDIGVVSGLPGAPVFAVYYGLVVEAGYLDQGGYGRRVVIEHEDRKYTTLYAHLKDVHVKAGDVVTTGQQIGTMGGNVDDKYRGASGGTHLHFEVILPQPVKNAIHTFKGYCVDPIPFLMNRYYTAPINAVQVTSVKGLRVRAKASVTSDSVNTLFMGDVVNVAEIAVDNGTAQWVKLWTLRDEWVAIKYNNLVNAKFTLPIDSTNQTDPTPDLPTDAAPTFQDGYVKAVRDIQIYLEGLL